MAEAIPEVNDEPALKVCMFSNLYPPINSGSSTFTWNLARRLAARGHRVSVVTARVDDTAEREEADGVSVHRLASVTLPRLAIAHNFKWMTYTFTPRNMRRLRGLFESERFDVIHQQNHVFDTILSSPRLARRHDLPLILTVHTWAQHPHRLLNSGLTALDALARKVIFDKSDRVVSPDPVVQKYVESRHRVPDSPVIPYGIETAPPRAEDVAELRRRYGLDDGSPVVLSLGHVNSLRDRLDLIEAMPRVLQGFPAAKLLIVGEVCVREPVELARKLGLEGRVIFTGAVPHSEVPAFFALSALETHTFNGNYPGPGIASMEAMAAGLPVVTVEIDDEYDFSHFRNWENVVMVPNKRPEVLAEAITRLLGDEGLRRRVGEQARSVMSERYSWDSICDAYVGVYRRAIEQRQAARAGAAEPAAPAAKHRSVAGGSAG